MGGSKTAPRRDQHVMPCIRRPVLAYSCKGRLFCPSCQQKRVLLFAEWLDAHILEKVSHAQFVFTIPKLLRPIFKYHPRELGLLCKSAWQRRPRSLTTTSMATAIL
jgi:hypothetical protein